MADWMSRVLPLTRFQAQDARFNLLHLIILQSFFSLLAEKIS